MIIARSLFAAALCGACLAPPASTQIPFTSRKIRLKRALPPAVELEARTFNITASSQAQGAQEVAASLSEMFKAKIQGDERFIYEDKNPALRVSIVLTRYYIEPKQLSSGNNNRTCTTNLGNLQGTFRVVESMTGRPLASDAIGWKIQAGTEQHVMVADDGREVPVTGPREKMNWQSLWGNSGETSNRKPGILNRAPLVGKKTHPCDVPFSANEARDALADTFLTDIIHLSTPYTVVIDVPVPGPKFLRPAVEEAAAERWNKALDLTLALNQQPKADDESDRLYLMALAYEGLGYKQGERAFELNKAIHSKLPADELARQQAELRRVIDLAKEYFDKASLNYTKANEAKDNTEARGGERRADQSRKLYVRIQRYRDLRPESSVAKPAPAALTKNEAPVQAVSTKRETPAPKAAAAAASGTSLSMAQITGMCSQGLAEVIIVDAIETAGQISATRAQAAELAKCKEKQTAVFNALKKRWDAK